MNRYRMIIGGRLVATGEFLSLVRLLPSDSELLVGADIQQKPNEYKFTFNDGKSRALIQKISKEEQGILLL